MINLPVTAAVTPREVLNRVDSSCLEDDKSQLMCDDFLGPRGPHGIPSLVRPLVRPLVRKKN